MNKKGLSKILIILIVIGAFVMLVYLLVMAKGYFSMIRSFTSPDKEAGSIKPVPITNMNIDFTINGHITHFYEQEVPDITMYADSITSSRQNPSFFFNYTKSEGKVTVLIRDPNLLNNKDKFVEGAKIQVKGDIIEQAVVSKTIGLSQGFFVAKEILFIQ